MQDINAQSSLIIRTLEPQDIPVIVKAFQGIGWRSKTTKLYLSYLNEQNSRKRTIFVALLGGVFTGYVTVKWQSDYPPFIERYIPEIADLNVLPKYRRRGIATLLVEEAERRIFEISDSAGIGFGIAADYGPAQRMYICRGYIPDGRGLFANGRYIQEGTTLNVDDCVIYLTKEKNKIQVKVVSRNSTKKEMTGKDAIAFYADLVKIGIRIWIDGGWGVDALIGKQTRSHSDLDIVIEKKDLNRTRLLVEKQGYKDVERDDTSPWNFVLGDNEGHEIDFHIIVFDDKGNGIYGPPERNEMYPADSLSGSGAIDGHSVKCISPEYQIKFHSGYKLKEKDYQDITALKRKSEPTVPKVRT